MTFIYWWMNLVQGIKALSAKKWFVRDNPQAQGFTAQDIRNKGVKSLARNLVGYTADIPGTTARKETLRRLILAMVHQIEIETCDPGQGTIVDIPFMICTMTSQLYHWDELIISIADLEVM